MVRTLALAFLVVNVLGFITYFVYPVAPPWYVAQYGLGPARVDIHPDAAAAAPLAQFLGPPFFDEMCGGGGGVYGPLPSLHVAYPLVAIAAAFREPLLRWA